MTYEEKKAWLRRYQQAKRLEQLRLDELDTLKTDASNMTQCLSAVPGGGGDGQTLPRAVERIDEARGAYKAQCEESTRIRKEIIFALQQLDDELDFTILYRRYICGHKWELIADRLSSMSVGSSDDTKKRCNFWTQTHDALKSTSSSVLYSMLQSPAGKASLLPSCWRPDRRFVFLLLIRFSPFAA